MAMEIAIAAAAAMERGEPFNLRRVQRTRCAGLGPSFDIVMSDGTVQSTSGPPACPARLRAADAAPHAARGTGADRGPAAADGADPGRRAIEGARALSGA